MRQRLLPLLLLLVSPILTATRSPAVVSDWGEHEPVRVRLVAPWEIAPREATLWLGFEVDLAEGWHIYWKNSGDAGFPPTLEVRSDPPLASVTLRFPAPERYPVPGGLVAIGYEGRMVYPLEAGIDAPDAETIDITLVADYLVCEEDCIPFHDELALSLPLGEPVPDPVIESLLANWRDRLPRPADEIPGVSVTGRRTGSELIVTVRGDRVHDDGTDLFFEPVEGVLLGEPAPDVAGDRATFRVPIRPADVRAGIPDPLQLTYVVTGLESDEAPVAVEGRFEVREAAPGAAPDRARPTVPDLLLDGLLLALTPSVLALLGLLLAWPQRQLRETLGPLSEVWPFVAGSFTGFVVLVLGLDAWGDAVETPFFVSPAAATLTALPSLALALWVWFGHPTEVHRPRSLGRDLAASLVAPLLALPWFPAAGDLAPVATGRGEPIEGAVAAAGFSIPFLLAGAFVTLRSSDTTRETHPVLARSVGFLALLTLVWISYRLLDLTSTDRLAFVQLSWLAAALAARMAATTRGRVRAVWWVLAVLLAVGSTIPVGR